MENLTNLTGKVNKYKLMLANTKSYRQDWKDTLKDTIIKSLTNITTEVGLDVEISVDDNIESLERIVLDLGKEESGIKEKVDSNTFRPLIKSNGVLVYQQLFNGKVAVWIGLPYIEGVGEPQAPHKMEIFRPQEISEGHIVRHMEEFLRAVTDWEDYDDDNQPKQQIGFIRNLAMQNPEEAG